MSLRSFFTASQAPPQLSAQAREYQQRVVADGGAVFSPAAVQEAYARAASWSLDPALTHWTSPQFGVRLDSDGTVSKRYCLFGHDAAPVTPGRNWTPVYSPGLPPQHLVNEAGRGFVIPAFAWPSRALTAVATCVQLSRETPIYPFFPLVEQSANWNYTPGWLMGIEMTTGGSIGGVSSPYAYLSNAGLSPLGYPDCQSLVVDPGQPTLATQLVYRSAAQQATYYAQSNNIGTTPYSQDSVYLGQRGDSPQYYWAGTINDVFFTNKALPAAARAWLENQRWCYADHLPRPGDVVLSTDARWQELAGYWNTVDYTDQPLVRYAEPGNSGRCDIGFYGKRVVVEHSSFSPVRGYLYVDDVKNVAFSVSSPGQTTEIVCDTLGYHTLSLRQDPSEGYTARGILHVYAS